MLIIYRSEFSLRFADAILYHAHRKFKLQHIYISNGGKIKREDDYAEVVIYYNLIYTVVR